MANRLAKRIMASCLFATLSLQLCRSSPPVGAAPLAPSAPVRVADFLDTLGVGVHMGAVKGPYGGVPQVVADVQFLGFKHVRDGTGGMFGGVLTNGKWNPSPDSKLAMFSNAGIGLDLIVGPDLATSGPKIQRYVNYIESLEGPNEPDFNVYKYSGLTGNAAAVQVQKDLYVYTKANSALHNVPVLGIAFGRPSSTASVEKFSASADYANLHTYAPHGFTPRNHIMADLAATVDAPGRRFIITETGYPSNLPSGPPGARVGSGHNFVNEDVQAKYLLDTIFDSFQLGVLRTYLYQLYDATDPQDTDQEAHFGLYRVDYSHKPAANGIHNLTSILADPGPGGRGFSPTPLSYSIRLAPGQMTPQYQIFSLLLEKQNGAYDLVLWSEPPLWSPDLKPQAPPPPVNLSVAFATPHSTARIFDPLISDRPQASYPGVRGVNVQVSDHPIIIEIAGR